MLYVIIGLGVMFLAIAFLVTERNAKYVLSGYNTMSEEERQNVDLKNYMLYFKKFHVFLALSFLGFGLAIYWVNINAAGVFLGVYPILAYGYFMATSARFYNGVARKKMKLAMLVLAGTLLFVIGLLIFGFQESKLTYDALRIEISGSYGESLDAAEIASIQLVDELPEISYKANGFGLGNILKGYYKTKDGETVKLLLNDNNPPFILLTKSDGERVFFSARDQSNEEIFTEMKNIVPAAKFQ